MNPVLTTVPAQQPADVDAAVSWSPRFPTSDLIAAAGGLFQRFEPAEQHGVAGTLPAWWVDHGGAKYLIGGDGPRGWMRGTPEARVSRLVIAPGCVQVTCVSAANAERSREAREAGELAFKIAAGVPDKTAWKPRPRIAAWSPRSRARMTKRLAQLDYSPVVGTGRRPAMLTLTYPGDWLAVVPTSRIAAKHVENLRRRYWREFGEALVGTWKREFQRRGAPHLHIFAAPPEHTRSGETFRAWLLRTWAEVVGAEGVDGELHRVAGTSVDYAHGAKMRDPRRLAVYFSKHGSFSAKDYQNEPPEEWLAEGVGRFWGYWGLKADLAMVDVEHVDALAVARTLRRLSNSRGGMVTRRRYRRSERLDPATGELVQRGRYRRSTSRVRRLRGTLGFLVVNDGAAIASQLARMLETTRPRAGTGPVGFLP